MNRRSIMSIVMVVLLMVNTLAGIPAKVFAGTDVQDISGTYTPGAWPTVWNPYKKLDGTAVKDGTGAAGNETGIGTSADLSSGASSGYGSLPSIYVATDGTNAFFRIRLLGTPEYLQGTSGRLDKNNWQVNLYQSGSQKATVGVTGKDNSVDYVYVSDGTGAVVRYIYMGPFDGTTQGARFYPAPDSTIGEYFLDFQAPISVISQYSTGSSVTAKSKNKMYFGTSYSTNLSQINKDYMSSGNIATDLTELADVSLDRLNAPTNDVTGPTAVTASVYGSTLQITMNEANSLDSAYKPSTGAFSVTAGGVPVTVTGVTVGSATKIVTLTLAASVPPSSQVIVTYTDPTSGDDTYAIQDDSGNDASTFTLTIAGTNQAPVATLTSLSAVEDTPQPVTLTGTDADNDTLTYSITAQPAHGTLTGTGSSLTYTPAANYYGSDSFTYTVTDGKAVSSPQSVSITVAAVNDAPSASGQSVTVPQDGSKVIVLGGTDADGDTLSYNVTVAPVNGILSPIAGGTVTYTPAQGFSGSDSFVFTASDGQASSSTAVVSITVSHSNNAPAATLQSVTASEDTPEPITLTGTDADNDTLTYSLTAQPAHGTLTGTGSSLTYTPAPNYYGSDSFTYTVSDGTATSAPQTVSISVTAVNDVPTAVQQTVSTGMNTPVTIQLGGTDADNDALVFRVASGPSHGTLGSIVNGAVLYTPDTSYEGTDSFTFQAEDGNGGVSSPATVSLSISNAAPQYTSAATNSSQTMTVGSAPVALAAADGDNDTLTYELASGQLPDGLTLLPDGSFQGKARANATGTYTFQVKVSDGKGGAAFTTLVLTVGPGNAAVNGEVRSATGGLLSQIPVQLLDTDGTVLFSTYSGAQGTFIFAGLPAGEYTAVTLSKERPLASATVPVGAGETKAANLTMPDVADLVLTAEPAQLVGDGVSTSTLTATLKYKDGTAASNVAVHFTTTSGALSAADAVTDADGIARVVLTAPVINGVLPKTETLEMTVRDAQAGIYAEKSIPVTFLPASIQGIVTDSSTGLPLANAVVSIAEDFDQDGVVDFTATVTTGSDGKYMIVVPQGNYVYKVHIQAPVRIGDATYTVDTVQNSQVGTLTGVGETIYAPREISGKLLVAGQGEASPQQLNQVFQSGEGVVGEVRDRNGNKLSMTVQIGSDGSYKVENVTPGDYEVFFQVTAPTGEKLAGTKMKVSVSQQGEIALQIGLIDPYGIVSDSATGAPIENVKMMLYWADTPLNVSKGRAVNTLVALPELPAFAPNQNKVPQYTTALGEYAWLVFPDGDYYIVATKAGYETYDSRVEGRDVGSTSDDSYIQDGVIHVGTTIVEFSLNLVKASVEASTGGGGGAAPVVVTPTPEKPQVFDHTRYITGYPDRTFRPEKSITRAEVAAVLVRLRLKQLEVEQTAAPYADVASEHWASGFIAAAKRLNIMEGYSDGNFYPEKPISRAELAAVIIRYKGLALQAGGSYPDTKGEWAETYIHTAAQVGYMQGYPDGLFRPNQSTSRAEFVTAVNRVEERGPLEGKPNSTWSDVPAAHWALKDIEEASTDHSYTQTGGHEWYYSKADNESK